MSREDVWKLINKKKNRIKEIKKRRFSGPYSIIAEFINAMDDATENCSSADLFYLELKTATNTLDSRMKMLDPEIELKVMWNDENKLSSKTDWRDLRVDGVKIMWSRFYLGKNPLVEAEKYIDVGQLFIEGYFSEE